MEHLEASSIDAVEEVLPVSQDPTWMDAYIRYLNDDTLSDDHSEAKLLKWRAFRFLMLDGRLYRRSFSYPILKLPVGLPTRLLAELLSGVALLPSVPALGLKGNLWQEPS